MSIYKGSKLVAGSNTTTISDIIKLFKHDWYDYSFSDLSWVRADDFEWIYADRYPIAYEHLYADFISTSTWQSETIGSYTIQFKIAPDGHRITDHANEGTVQNIYGQSGVAWYYIIDTVNERFKLPRTKHGITGLRDEVGKYVPESLPNITGSVSWVLINDNTAASGALSLSTNVSDGVQGSTSTSKPRSIKLNAHDSNNIYQDNAPVQERATQQYLYFYLGQFPVSALVNPDIAETKVNTSMDNLNSVGRNIANWSSNVTNCITEIPQDIKLELNDGTLTLKAGSKVYVPDGFEADGTTPKFDVITINQDITNITGWANLTGLVLAHKDGSWNFTSLSQCTSGSTEPVQSDGNLWYDTSTNLVKRWNSTSATSWTSGYALPIALATSNNSNPSGISGYASIDQVFNGFGYIGSTVFALPGVKGLIPNGWNKDGTLKNIEVINNSVLINTFTESRGNWKMYLENTTPIRFRLSSGITYLEDVNRNHYDATNAYIDVCCLGSVENVGSLNISKFIPKTPFHAVDYNDKSTIVGWGMPDYSAGVTYSSDFVAPSNGYLFCRNQVGAWGVARLLADGAVIDASHNPTAGTAILTHTRGFCKKGQTISKDGVTAWENAIFYPLIGG